MPAIEQISNAAPRTIFVVEDDPLIHSMLSLALRRWGHRVITVGDGLEAVAMLERDIHTIDLLLSDVSLPGLRGPEVAARALAMRPDLKVILSSGSLFPDETSDTLDGHPFLRKPFTIEKLRSTINEAFLEPAAA
jgi:CheY-like chemotaxis protein